MAVSVLVANKFLPRILGTTTAAYKTPVPRFGQDEADRFDGSEQKSLWNKGAEAWASVVAQGQNLYHTLFLYPEYERFIGPVKGLKVLDAGCGEGVWSRRMAEQGAEVTGVDLSKNMLAQARRAERENPLGIQYQTSDFSSLKGVPSNSFDKVVTTMTMMYLPDFEKMYKAFYRVLKPGGELVIITKHPVQARPVSQVQWQLQDGEPTGVMLSGDYFHRQGFTHRATLHPEGKKVFVDTVHYQHTVSDHINPLVQAGFELSEISEPPPSDEACQQLPILKQWKTIPFMLMLRARKPE